MYLGSHIGLGLDFVAGPASFPNVDEYTDLNRQARKVRLRPLLAAGVRISMDGRGRWIDNRFIERLWRSLKHEAVYLEELAGGHHARRVIASWLDHCNHRRPHFALDGNTPAEVHFEATRRQPLREAA